MYQVKIDKAVDRFLEAHQSDNLPLRFQTALVSMKINPFPSNAIVQIKKMK